jgi:hypothetical protein
MIYLAIVNSKVYRVSEELYSIQWEVQKLFKELNIHVSIDKYTQEDFDICRSEDMGGIYGKRIFSEKTFWKLVPSDWLLILRFNHEEIEYYICKEQSQLMSDAVKEWETTKTEFKSISSKVEHNDKAFGLILSAENNAQDLIVENPERFGNYKDYNDLEDHKDFFQLALASLESLLSDCTDDEITKCFKLNGFFW